MENKELRANLKENVATVWEEKKAAVKELATKAVTVWEEKKTAVKAMKSATFLKKKAGTKAATSKREAKTTLAWSKRKSAREQQTQKESHYPLHFDTHTYY